MSNETNKGSGKRSSREVLNNHGVSWEIPEWEDILAAMEEYAAQQAPAGTWDGAPSPSKNITTSDHTEFLPKAPSAGVSKERVREILEDHYEWLVKGDGEALYSSVANRINWYLATFAPSSEQPTKAN